VALSLPYPFDRPSDETSSGSLTWTSVELVGLCDVSAAEFDALTDLRSDGRARVSSWCDRVEIGGASERVAGVVHDAVEVVRLTERVHLSRCQGVEVVLLPCNRHVPLTLLDKYS